MIDNRIFYCAVYFNRAKEQFQVHGIWSDEATARAAVAELKTLPELANMAPCMVRWRMAELCAHLLRNAIQDAHKVAGLTEAHAQQLTEMDKVERSLIRDIFGLPVAMAPTGKIDG